MQKAKVAHRLPGRLRVKLDGQLTKSDVDKLVKDLKVSPEISKVSVRGSSIVIEHADDKETDTAVGKALGRVFPGFEDWSNEFDESRSGAQQDRSVYFLVSRKLVRSDSSLGVILPA